MIINLPQLKEVVMFKRSWKVEYVKEQLWQWFSLAFIASILGAFCWAIFETFRLIGAI